MNDQPTPPNAPSAGERPAGFRPEDLQATNPNVAPVPVPEVKTGAGTGGAPATPVPAPKLSAADVAAALAAVPTPGPVLASAGVPVPGTAADVDLIEPEWVAKAEDVVMKHQGDPYGEEEAIEDLQRDYLQKRYGMTVKEPGSDSGQAGAP